MRPREDFEAERLAWRPYSYLLGLYLGDGCLSHEHDGVYSLRITLDRRHRMILVLCEEAMLDVLPNRVSWADKGRMRQAEVLLEAMAVSLPAARTGS